ncbi:MAG TPA: substrate-binding domain-containing protein [Gemmatimonadaceae bacterium]|nr:substrate-binding domain-containing protein [Gemmatimonadaceae bacterium]
MSERGASERRVGRRDRWYRHRIGRRGIALAAGTALVAAALAAAPARAPREFRVCSDPNNLPFSNRQGEGFENRIAELFARDLHASVTYDWLAQQRGFSRKTLKTGTCDVIMGVPAHYDPVLTTKPYYRTTYAFVFRTKDGPRVTSLDDTVLKHVKIGIHVIGDDYENPPPAQALALRGIISNVKGYRMVDDYSKPNPPSHIIDAVARGDIDVAIVYGPFAGYFAPKEPVKLSVVPMSQAVDPLSGFPFTYEIAMGVRKDDPQRAAMLDSLIDRERPAIDSILKSYGIPMLPIDTARTAATGQE